MANAARIADAMRLQEAFPLFEQAQARARETGDRPSEAPALLGLGRIHGWQVRIDQSRAMVTEALRIYTALGDDLGPGVGARGAVPLRFCAQPYAIDWLAKNLSLPPSHIRVAVQE